MDPDALADNDPSLKARFDDAAQGVVRRDSVERHWSLATKLKTYFNSRYGLWWGTAGAAGVEGAAGAAGAAGSFARRRAA